MPTLTQPGACTLCRHLSLLVPALLEWVVVDEPTEPHHGGVRSGLSSTLL